MKTLEEVMARNAPHWTEEQRQSLRTLAWTYLSMQVAGMDEDQLVEEIRAVAPPAHPLDPSASWIVFSTWLIQRAARFGQRLRPSPAHRGPTPNPADPFGVQQRPVQPRPAPRLTLGYSAPPFDPIDPKPAPATPARPQAAPVPSERPEPPAACQIPPRPPKGVLPPQGMPWHPAMERPQDCAKPDG